MDSDIIDLVFNFCTLGLLWLIHKKIDQLESLRYKIGKLETLLLVLKGKIEKLQQVKRRD